MTGGVSPKLTQMDNHEKKYLSVSQTERYIAHRRSGALNFTGTEASGADVDVGGSAIHDRLDALHVGLPGPVGATVRVAHLNAEGHALVAKLALCHGAEAPPY